MNVFRRLVILLLLLPGSLRPGFVNPTEIPLSPQATASSTLTFAITSDQRYFTGSGTYDSSSYYRGAIQALVASGPVEFLISPGDIDPPDASYWTLQSVAGSSIPWFPVVGNHELPGAGSEPSLGANLAWINAFDVGSVTPGPSGCPKTTYSFDRQNAHFIVLNEYCDTAGDAVTTGDLPDHLYNWLKADLEATSQPFIFVIGHEPAYPQPDQTNQRLRHETDSLNQYPTHRDRFWALLQQHHITAYLCGHTHNYSAVKMGGVWQIDSGHARGLGDTGAASTFVKITVTPIAATFITYRDDSNGGPYQPAYRGVLAGPTVYFPIIARSVR